VKAGLEEVLDETVPELPGMSGRPQHRHLPGGEQRREIDGHRRPRSSIRLDRGE
jgi:hypothetical protein